MTLKTTLIGITLIALMGCNTAVGAAKDVYGGTKYVVKKVGGSGDKDD